MKPLQHKHDDHCKYGGGFLHYLVEAAPDFLWFDVQDVGDYQGSVYGVALYKGEIGIYEDGYGSCSGCGAWGEGGEPSNQSDAIARTTFFKDREGAIEYIAKLDSYNSPDKEKLIQAVKEADKFRKK